ncbi:hypothetical protein HOLleu_19522 [Holothuria leucospilota]|uniref:Uncharacterized protein n=1 Tax=Holothuria leucospilota TaxID=206669 RepID=A0A9Q1C066_HOLLE|nr:hypothetical protein HOLleu_19522 [Holothuria leucospilota]
MNKNEKNNTGYDTLFQSIPTNPTPGKAINESEMLTHDHPVFPHGGLSYSAVQGWGCCRLRKMLFILGPDS